MSREELTPATGTSGSSQTHRMPTFLRPGREVALLAAVQIIAFLALTQLEPRFFVIHLYQLVPYIAIVLLVAFRQERWAYMAGPLVSLGWIALASMAGLLGSVVERLRSFGSFSTDANLVTLLAILTATVAVLMTTLCRIHWVKECSGYGRTWSTFLVTLAMVAVYYAILLRWFWDMVPSA